MPKSAPAPYIYRETVNASTKNAAIGDISGRHIVILNTSTGMEEEAWISRSIKAEVGDPIHLVGSLEDCAIKDPFGSFYHIPSFTYAARHVQTYEDLVTLANKQSSGDLSHGQLSSLADACGVNWLIKRLTTTDEDTLSSLRIDHILSEDQQNELFLDCYRTLLSECLRDTWNQDSRLFVPAVEKLKIPTVIKINQNPYFAFTGTKGGSFDLADLYSERIGVKEKLSAVRGVSIVRQCLDDSFNDSSTMVEEEYIVQKMQERGVANPSDHINTYIKKGKGVRFVEPTTQKGYVTTEEKLANYLATSKNIIKGMMNFSTGTPLSCSDHEIESAVKNSLLKLPFTMNEGQTDVINKVLTNNLVLVQGGPGTGKTTVVSTAIDSYAQLFRSKHGREPKTLLLGPTAKSVENINKSTGGIFPSMTLHAALGAMGSTEIPDSTGTGILRNDDQAIYDYRETKNSKSKPILSADLVVIDESSMIDTELMAKVFEMLYLKSKQVNDKLSAGDYRLIVLGDNDQLPSPSHSSGCDFRDYSEIFSALQAEGIAGYAVGQLSETNRFGQAHQKIAKDILEGRVPHIDSGDTSCPGTLLRYYNDDSNRDREHLSIDEILADDLMESFFNEFQQYIALTVETSSLDASQHASSAISKAANDFLKENQIITPLRPGPAGTDTLNKKTHDLVRRLVCNGTGNDELKMQGFGHTLFAGTKIICKRNIGQEMFNGDVGFISSITKGREPSAQATFNSGKTFTITPSNCSDFKLGYAQTFHSTQGDEYNNIYLALPKSSMRMMSNNLLYTGFTRLKKTIKMFLSEDAALSAVKNKINRKSPARFVFAEATMLKSVQAHALELGLDKKNIPNSSMIYSYTGFGSNLQRFDLSRQLDDGEMEKGQTGTDANKTKKATLASSQC